MRECNNNKIHISSNFLLSICLIIMLDTLLLVPSLHCSSNRGNWNHLKIIQKIREQNTGKAQNRGTTEISHIGYRLDG